MVLFKFGGSKIICQTAKLNTPPIILRIYIYTVVTIGYLVTGNDALN